MKPTGLLLGFTLSLTLPLTAHASAQADLGGIKRYLLGKTDRLVAQTAALAELGDRYYALAEAEGFDYAALWQGHAEEVAAVVTDAREAWTAASPLYEQIEGIVAGTPSLAQFDVDLDAGGAPPRTRRTPCRST